MDRGNLKAAGRQHCQTAAQRPALLRPNDMWVGLSLWCNPALTGVMHTALACYLEIMQISALPVTLKGPVPFGSQRKVPADTTFLLKKGPPAEPWTATAVALQVQVVWFIT